MSESANLPDHVGIIIDGNRRWAKTKGLAKVAGHKAGFDLLKDVARYALLKKNIEYLTAYVFSTENWNREPEEINYLMKLALKVFKSDLQQLHKDNIKVQVLGSKDKLSAELKAAIDHAEQLTSSNSAGVFSLCFNYGGKQEIVDAVNKIKTRPITAEEITSNLYHSQLPDVDLLIRTSGEQRISNFMLWRLAYAEMLFVDKNWPDFSNQDFDDCLIEYSQRERRHGGGQ